MYPIPGSPRSVNCEILPLTGESLIKGLHKIIIILFHCPIDSVCWPSNRVYPLTASCSLCM